MCRISDMWRILDFLLYQWITSEFQYCFIIKYPTSEIGVRLLAIGQQFTLQNLDQLYVLVSSGHKTTCRDMTCTVLKAK